MVVYRPINPQRFDGTVVVEWLNVSGGVDAAAAWLTDHVQMIRSGMVYVGVSVQATGIVGNPTSLGGAGGHREGSRPVTRSDTAPSSIPETAIPTACSNRPAPVSGVKNPKLVLGGLRAKACARPG